MVVSFDVFDTYCQTCASAWDDGVNLKAITIVSGTITHTSHFESHISYPTACSVHH